MLSNLPTELIRLIFQFVRGEDLIELERTCKLFLLQIKYGRSVLVHI